jgi:hypothetical protein
MIGNAVHDTLMTESTQSSTASRCPCKTVVRANASAMAIALSSGYRFFSSGRRLEGRWTGGRITLRQCMAERHDCGPGTGGGAGIADRRLPAPQPFARDRASQVGPRLAVAGTRGPLPPPFRALASGFCLPLETAIATAAWAPGRGAAPRAVQELRFRGSGRFPRTRRPSCRFAGLGCR